MNDEDISNVIPFKKKEEKKPLKLRLDRESIQSVILAISAIHRSTDVSDDCKKDILTNGIPCNPSGCSCYTHMISSMALEIIFEGPRSEEAAKAIMFEYINLEENSEDDHGEDS